MILYDLIDIKELEGFNFNIEYKPEVMFIYFAYDKEGLGKAHTTIVTADRDGNGWLTLIQTINDSPHLADIEINNDKLIKAIFR